MCVQNFVKSREEKKEKKKKKKKGEPGDLFWRQRPGRRNDVQNDETG